MTDGTAEEFRAKAQKCEEEAERAKDTFIAERWRDLARQHRELAEKAESQPQWPGNAMVAPLV
jgi:hypothetical protein